MADSFRSAEELREVLDTVMRAVDRDPKAGARMRAAGVAYKVEFPDLGLALNVAPSEEPDHPIRWSFDEDVPWKPQVQMSMDSDVANSYFQGEENVGIALARRRIRMPSCDPASALRLLPATRSVVEFYRTIVEREYPHLALHHAGVPASARG